MVETPNPMTIKIKKMILYRLSNFELNLIIYYKKKAERLNSAFNLFITIEITDDVPSMHLHLF